MDTNRKLSFIHFVVVEIAVPTQALATKNQMAHSAESQRSIR